MATPTLGVTKRRCAHACPALWHHVVQLAAHDHALLSGRFVAGSDEHRGSGATVYRNVLRSSVRAVAQAALEAHHDLVCAATTSPPGLFDAARRRRRVQMSAAIASNETPRCPSTLMTLYPSTTQQVVARGTLGKN